MPTEPTPWTRTEPTRSPFALPAGLGGRLAGRIMLWLNKQDDVVDLLDVRDGQTVLEVGFGPGGLIRRLCGTPAARIHGVDPSRQMRLSAARLNAAAIRAGRVELRPGTAAATGFADAAFDRVVSVNTVAIWPDLRAGLRELHRVTRSGGRALIAWHGGTHPSRIARGNALPADRLATVTAELDELFTEVNRHELAGLTAWTAVRVSGTESATREAG